MARSPSPPRRKRGRTPPPGDRDHRGERRDYSLSGSEGPSGSRTPPRKRDNGRGRPSPDNRGRTRGHSPDRSREINRYPERRGDAHPDGAREPLRGRAPDSPRGRESSPHNGQRRDRVLDSPRRGERPPHNMERRGRVPDSPLRRDRSPRQRDRSLRGRERSPDDGFLREKALAAHRTRNRSPPPPREGRVGRQASESPPRARRRVDARSPDRGGPYPPRRGGRAEDLSDAPPAVGSIHRAVVQSVRPFGVFVELPGFRRHGLVHHSQVADDVAFSREDEDDMKVKAMEYFMPRSSQVWVKVLEVRDDGTGNPKVNCSARAVDQDTGADLDPSNRLAFSGGPGGGGGPHGGPQSNEPPEIGSIHRATVATVKPFGAFVRIQGFRSNGLVHFTQISDYLDLPKEDSDEAKAAAIGQVLEVGEPVYVKVLEVKEDDGSGRGPKVGCSIKLVDQKSGEDLDVHNLKWQPRREGEGRGRAPIGSAVAKVEQGGKIDWGHLTADTTKYRGAEKYSLVGNEIDDIPAPPPPAPLQRAGNTGRELAPMGRGRAAVMPAWMEQQANGVAPTSPTVKVEGGMAIQSVEEALAIMQRYGGKKAHKKKKKKEKGEKDKKEKKGKKAKKSKKQTPSSSSSDSD